MRYGNRARRRGVLALATLAAGAGLPASCSVLTGPEVITLFVASRKVDCVGVGPRTCLRTRESGSDPWTAFYDSIEGFEFEPGFFYELRVAVYRVGPVPADGSSRRYVLREIVSKTPEAEFGAAAGPAPRGPTGRASVTIAGPAPVRA